MYFSFRKKHFLRILRKISLLTYILLYFAYLFSYLKLHMFIFFAKKKHFSGIFWRVIVCIFRFVSASANTFFFGNYFFFGFSDCLLIVENMTFNLNIIVFCSFSSFSSFFSFSSFSSFPSFSSFSSFSSSSSSSSSSSFSISIFSSPSSYSPIFEGSMAKTPLGPKWDSTSSKKEAKKWSWLKEKKIRMNCIKN